MNFHSFQYLIFFPIVSFLYYLVPGAASIIYLLLASYVFYIQSDWTYALILLLVTVWTYGMGRSLERRREKGGSNRILIPILILTFLPLVILKYSSFFLQNINMVTGRLLHMSFSPIQLILPAGISFYTFQAVGYLIDVWKGKQKAEKDFLCYALFLSFFPLIMSGPIERAGHLIPQFREKHRFSAEKVRDALLLMVWGFFLKLVVSERLAGYVNPVINDYQKYGGCYLILAIIFFTFQLYLDFESYSCIAIGSAGVMGFELFKNFNQPFLGMSMTGFWRRWHMSLTNWFRDYLYIPLGGNRKGKVKQYRNILIVFGVSGLWHGASWNYVVWGLLNGFYQVIGMLLKPFKEKIGFHSGGQKRDIFSRRLLKTFFTFFLFGFSLIFFKAPSFMTGIGIIKGCAIWNPWVFFDGSMSALGLTPLETAILVISLAIVVADDILHEKGIHIRERLAYQETWFRWALIICAVISILVFGKYGPGYKASDFIYFKF